MCFKRMISCNHRYLVWKAMLVFKKDAIWALYTFHESFKDGATSKFATKALLQPSAQKSEAVGMSRFLVRDGTLQLHAANQELGPNARKTGISIDVSISPNLLHVLMGTSPQFSICTLQPAITSNAASMTAAPFNIVAMRMS